VYGECHANLIVWIGPGFGPKKVATKKITSDRSSTPCSTNPANLVNVGPVDVEIICLRNR